MTQTFILTWNPDRWTWPQDGYEDIVDLTASGEICEDAWSIAIRKSGIEEWDWCYLLRQHRDRGIVGMGMLPTGEIYEDEHFEPDLAASGEVTRYVEVMWQRLVDPDDRLPLEVLESEVPGVSWSRLQGSGVRVPDESRIALNELWSDHLAALDGSRLPEEIDGQTFAEGASRRVKINRYERDPRARAACISNYGTTCFVCGLDFAARYGDLGRGFIHVHHLKELSTLGEGYEVDPIKDLRPVCPNCHAMLHQQRPAMSVEDLQGVLR